MKRLIFYFSTGKTRKCLIINDLWKQTFLLLMVAIFPTKIGRVCKYRSHEHQS